LPYHAFEIWIGNINDAMAQRIGGSLTQDAMPNGSHCSIKASLSALFQCSKRSTNYDPVDELRGGASDDTRRV